MSLPTVMFRLKCFRALWRPRLPIQHESQPNAYAGRSFDSYWMLCAAH